MDKESIRKTIAELKSRLSKEDVKKRSSNLAEALAALPEYKAAHTVFAYMSINQEVCTDQIIKRAVADGKSVAVPRVICTDKNGRKLPLSEQSMEFVYIDGNTVCAENKGIREPVGGDVADCDALVVIPGLAFGRDMNRIGYGGGFYDRYFASHREREFVKVALCYDFQVFDSLPADEHDEKIDILIVG